MHRQYVWLHGFCKGAVCGKLAVSWRLLRVRGDLTDFMIRVGAAIVFLLCLNHHGCDTGGVFLLIRYGLFSGIAASA